MESLRPHAYGQRGPKWTQNKAMPSLGAASIPSNFAFLRVRDEPLVRFGMLVARYFPGDHNPN